MSVDDFFGLLPIDEDGVLRHANVAPARRRLLARRTVILRKSGVARQSTGSEYERFKLDLVFEHGIADHLAAAARDMARVKGLTHEFYRYPARFSPTFVRAAIQAFTRPGDWVIDPFAGGGTTLVEAMALGRNALGIDISSLSSFICEAKIQVLSDHEVAAFQRWMGQIDKTINMHAPSLRHDDYADAGYYRNLEGPGFWRLRKAIEQALSSVERLRLRGSHVLARCVVLRAAQWALDSRKTRPSVAAFKSQMEKQAGSMLAAALEFREQVEGLRLPSRPTLSERHTATTVLACRQEPQV